MKAQEFFIDLKPSTKSNPIKCTASQYDVGRPYIIHLIDHDEAYEIPDSATVTLTLKKPDNTLYTDTCEYAGDYVTFETTTQMTAVEGRCLCEITITDGNDYIGTANFYLYVEKSPLEDGVLSESEINSLMEITQQAASYAHLASESADNAEASASESATSASEASESAEASATSAEASAASAEASEASAEESASSASSAESSVTSASESATAAAASAEASAASAEASATSAEESADSATLSESWAVGGTGARDGEDTDNAKYYAELASQSSDSAAESATAAAESASSFVLPEFVTNLSGYTDNAGFHNCLYRGRDLTDVYTIGELHEKVEAGDWSNLYIGDYITVEISTEQDGEDVTESVDLVFSAFD